MRNALLLLAGTLVCICAVAEEPVPPGEFQLQMQFNDPAKSTDVQKQQIAPQGQKTLTGLYAVGVQVGTAPQNPCASTDPPEWCYEPPNPPLDPPPPSSCGWTALASCGSALVTSHLRRFLLEGQTIYTVATPTESTPNPIPKQLVTGFTLSMTGSCLYINGESIYQLVFVTPYPHTDIALPWCGMPQFTPSMADITCGSGSVFTGSPIRAVVCDPVEELTCANLTTYNCVDIPAVVITNGTLTSTWEYTPICGACVSGPPLDPIVYGFMAVDRNHDGAYTDDDDIQFVTDTTASVAIDADTLPLRDWTGRLPAGPGVLVLGAVPAGGWTPDTEPTGVEFVRYRIDGGAVKLTRRALPMRTLIGRSPVTSDADLTAPDTGPLRARAWPSGTPVSFWNGWEPLVEQHFDGTTENFAIISTPPPGTSGPSVFRVDLLHEIDLALVEQYPGQRVHVVLWGADDANNVTGYPATGFPTVGPSSRVPLEAPLPGVVDMTDTRESYLLTRRVNRAPRSSF